MRSVVVVLPYSVYELQNQDEMSGCKSYSVNVGNNTNVSGIFKHRAYISCAATIPAREPLWWSCFNRCPINWGAEEAALPHRGSATERHDNHDDLMFEFSIARNDSDGSCTTSIRTALSAIGYCASPGQNTQVVCIGILSFQSLAWNPRWQILFSGAYGVEGLSVVAPTTGACLQDTHT